MIDGLGVVKRADDKGGYILEMNNFLDFIEEMDHLLLCSMQAQINNVIINDVPRCICHILSQSIKFPDHDASLRFDLRGTIPYAYFIYTTDRDMENYEWISLTSKGNYMTKILG